jgi:hypothetical protein
LGPVTEIPFDALLTEYLAPRAPISLKSLLVEPEHFSGMFYSPPTESSAIGHDMMTDGLVRTQLMLDATLFREWTLSPQLKLSQNVPQFPRGSDIT